MNGRHWRFHILMVLVLSMVSWDLYDCRLHGKNPVPFERDRIAQGFKA